MRNVNTKSSWMGFLLRILLLPFTANGQDAPTRLYFVAVGKTDQLTFNSAQNLVAFLKKDGFNYFYNETIGWHSWSNWRIYLSDFAPRLFK
jgi:enterochelin esterase-like enzyme